MSRRRKRRGDAAADLIPGLAIPDRGVPRRLRVERELHEELVAAVGSLRDPRIAVATITRVQMTDDLSFARVWVRAGLDGQDDREAMMKGLKRATGRIRGHLGRVLQLRAAPDLKFLYDDGLEAAERVNELLAEIASEDAARTSDPGEDG